MKHKKTSIPVVSILFLTLEKRRKKNGKKTKEKKK